MMMGVHQYSIIQHPSPSSLLPPESLASTHHFTVFTVLPNLNFWSLVLWFIILHSSISFPCFYPVDFPK